MPHPHQIAIHYWSVNIALSVPL